MALTKTEVMRSKEGEYSTLFTQTALEIVAKL